MGVHFQKGAHLNDSNLLSLNQFETVRLSEKNIPQAFLVVLGFSFLSKLHMYLKKKGVQSHVFVLFQDCPNFTNAFANNARLNQCICIMKMKVLSKRGSES